MEAEAREIAARYGLEAGDGLLDALMIAKQEIDGGPSNTAAQHIGDLLGVSSRMVFQHKSDKGAGPLWRSAWGRWVPSGLCTRYAVAACTPSEDEAVTVAELDRLDTLSDAAHRRLDAHVVNEYRRGVVEMLEMALFGDLDLVEDGAQKPELDEWRTRRAQLTAAVRAHVETRHANDAAEPREQGAIEKEIEAELRELARQMAERSLHEAGVSSGT